MDKAKRNDIHRRFFYLSSDDVSREKSFACSMLMGHFHELAMLVEECARDCREKSLALTALEEASMWAMRAIERHGNVERVMAANQEAVAEAAADALAETQVRIEDVQVRIEDVQVRIEDVQVRIPALQMGA